MTSQPFFKNIFTLGRPRLANFADIINISIMFIKKTFEDSKKVKRIRKYVLKCSLYLDYLTWKNLLISGEKKLVLAELTWFIHFLDVFLVRYDSTKFYHCRICVIGGIFWPAHPWVTPKRPIWIGLILIKNFPYWKIIECHLHGKSYIRVGAKYS